MIRRCLLLLVALLSGCSSGTGDEPATDDRLVVLGPSLVEMMCVAGLGPRIVGVDRYSAWPPSILSVQDVGGYSDPSLELIGSLAPTSIHLIGHNAALGELASTMGIPIHSYRFDTLDDILASADTIGRLYGDSVDLRGDLEAALDSVSGSRAGLESYSVLVVVYHEAEASGMTVAGHGTFLDDLLQRLGCSIAAPVGAGPWPAVSVEGILHLSPDRILCMFPDSPDTSRTAASEYAFWSGVGYEPPVVQCIFDPFVLVPGPRVARTAGRIAECLR